MTTRIEIGERKVPDWEGVARTAMRDRILAFGGDPDAVRGSVLASRGQAERIVAEHPEIDPATAVTIDVSAVDILGPSFAHELLHHWPHATLEGASEDNQASWDLASERVRG